MELLSIVLILLFLLILYQAIITLSRKSNRLPPGPIPLPLIGNLHLLVFQPHKSLANLAKKYGPIMHLKLGHVNTIVISSSTIAKSVLQKQDLAFSTRFVPDAIRAHDHHHYSVTFLPVSPRWRALRKVMNSNIFSANKLEADQELRHKKIQELILHCRKNCQTGQAVNVGQTAFITSLNLLSNIIFSKDLINNLSSDSAGDFKELVRNIMLVGKPNLADYFPGLEKLDPQGVRRQMTIHFGKMLKLFDRLINERVEQKKSKGVVENDLLDLLLTRSDGEIDRTCMERLWVDLFTAGTDTISSTVEWAMSELLRNPKVMEKVKVELAQVVGRGKPIKEVDISNLPYLWCVVKETLRIHSPAPFIPCKMGKDVEVCGYIVPKGSHVLINIWAIGCDSSVWENSSTFNPDRLCESKIDVRGHDFELIPFGAGRRICPGLPLAIRMIPLMLSSLLNSFDWKLERSLSPDQLDMEEKFGLTLQKAIPLRAIPVPL